VSEGGARVILDAGRATLELANPAPQRLIDDVEVGRQVSQQIRVAFEVDDATAAATVALTAAGAQELAPPTQTPWRSLNARLAAPAGLQITVFEELGDTRPARVVRPLSGRGAHGGPASVRPDRTWLLGRASDRSPDRGAHLGSAR